MADGLSQMPRCKIPEYPTCRDAAEWFPERVAAAAAGLLASGVPQQFWRYQEPVEWSRDHDTAWLRFEAATWKHSYEIAGRALAYRTRPSPPWSET